VGTSVSVALNCQQPLSFILPSVQKEKTKKKRWWGKGIEIGKYMNVG